ncbi:MAG: pyruvate kinase [Eubacteriales bacterium]|jgi:pyruvate kinase|nr:pyruvate kinase [Clostridiales bacterium]
MRKTKIICTIGPASESEETLREMMLAGMDVARLNFSHGTYDEHKVKIDRIKKLREELGLHTALMLDTKGPEIRLGKIKNGSATVYAGQKFTIYCDEREGDATGASVTYPGLYRDVRPGGTILIDDGLIELGIETIRGTDIVCTVINGGPISDRKGVNVPGTQLSIPFMSERDRADLEFGVKNDFDFVAASFTQSAEDIRQMRHELEKLGCTNIRIIAKIENAAGVENCDEILNEADGIMIARGDMGVEVPMETIPGIQKRLIERCYMASKQVITATQMLESMTKNPRPTRAEITDVANAIYDGTSAIMLSSETAAGLYPVEAVKTMAKIAERTESEIDYQKRFASLEPRGYSSVTGAISHATCTTAYDLHAAAIITVTKSGHTARMLSSYRPETPIIGCSPEPKTCRHMNMSWGVTPLLVEEKFSTDELLDHAVDTAYKHKLVEYGDLVVITTGMPLGISGTTNMLKVQIVGNVLISGTGIGTDSVCGTLCVCTGENAIPQDFEDGDIIVVPSASEKIIRYLRRARGIISERGGVDSYAAIVGQALGIPVIVGADGATKILRSGTAVTLDAARGIVVVNDKC